MKNFCICLILAIFSCATKADELADAMKAWDTQDYRLAYQIFNKLAKTGNADAQRQLGEMYGFGEGVTEDLAEAEKWIGRSIALGNKDAVASLVTVRQRAARKAEIMHYVNTYDGAEVGFEKFACTEPEIPIVSKTQKEIKDVDAKMKTWRACYERFDNNLAAALPAGKVIPSDISNLMSVNELASAKMLMSNVYSRINANARIRALQIIAAYDTWIKRTGEYAVEYARREKDDSERRRSELEANRERLRNPQTTAR
jgi:TPR repeat protein